MDLYLPTPMAINRASVPSTGDSQIKEQDGTGAPSLDLARERVARRHHTGRNINGVQVALEALLLHSVQMKVSNDN